MATRMDGMPETLEALQRPRRLRGEKGIIMPMTLLIMLLLTALGGALLTLSYAEIVQGRITQNRLQTLNLAEAGQVYARRALSLGDADPATKDLDGTKGTDQKQVFTDNQPVNWTSTPVLAGLQTGATGTVTIARHPTDTNSAVITSKAKLGAATKIVEVILRKQTSFFPGVRGAVTARTMVRTAGAMTVDGRDRKLDGTLLPNSGTYGVFTNNTFTQLGTSKLGGTVDGVDYIPANPPANTEVIQDGMPDALPDDPDEVVGQPVGTLQGMAMAAGTYFGGANACSDFKNFLASGPFTNGVVYVDLPAGGECIPINLSESSGILVFHNATGDARLRDIKGTSGCACFRGLIIADDIVNIHQTITGAVVSLTTTPADADGVIGQGRGKVLFSREALGLIFPTAPTLKIWPIYSWREVQ